MSDKIDTASDAPLDFAPAKQWAIHSAVLDYVEDALEDDDSPGPVVELVILEKIEAGDYRFTAFEYDRLRDILADYADSEETPDVDRNPANAVVDRIDHQCPGKVHR
ncbi:DUF7853 family protein [Halobacterium rubrum]|uniref:DUF7853 family protein n=1 Tax=Halobacterium TaxID=2239 RepID=UPI001F200B15|nr:MULTISPECIES: hypothetical protein [Halobacterium]MDH5020299.1 hypothetical protein [Halobacterium rubrum]